MHAINRLMHINNGASAWQVPAQAQQAKPSSVCIQGQEQLARTPGAL